MIFNGEVSRTESGALACDALLLAIFFYNQIFYGLDMWFVIIPLLIIGIYLTVFGVIPEKYHFTETSLEVWQRFRKITTVPYEAVFNMEHTSADNFVNLLQSNKVKVYYTAAKTKKLVICKPKDIAAFARELRNRCPEFNDDGQKSNLDVFFKN